MQKFVPVSLAISRFYLLTLKHLFAATCLLALVSGCAFPGVYKIDIQQGNIITEDMIEQLKPGMTRRQVRYVLGNPVLENTFDPTLESYVYTIQRGGEEIKKQVIKVHYKDDQLTHYTGELLPQEATGLTPRPRRERPVFDDRPVLPE